MDGDERANDSFLLALYEAVHLNRNFITALTTATDPSTPPSPANTLERGSTPPAPDSTDSPSPATPVEIETCVQPTNLLVTFLEYCSIVMQDTKTEESLSNVKLCFIIITCIAEDQFCNLLLHDANLVFTVPLHRLPMRHRKVVPERPPTHDPSPVLCWVRLLLYYLG
ncbi:Armadillo-like helical domain-containing protein 3 [Chionoecetes opilio]|uniref:Armadillo-like helical domain-containing protein 3 n=1 Tax=Chionoecetes opilio TaxID=41210 RepID=A0A8J5D251_CHIOP|nr:Armadillo-like helical domain-containing protein 3 [Chionoecetes opilio]